MRQLLYDINGFFFPVYCPVCGKPLHIKDQVLCLKCEQRMPRGFYTQDPDNPVSRIFWGRVHLEGATSLFRFEKGSKYQSLLHLLKYKGSKKTGIFLGKLLGTELLGTSFQQAHFIIPVPLHPKKEKIRGYNQSEIIAYGISHITGIPVNSKILFRNTFTDSQTRKTRFERWENMEKVFSLYSKLTISGKLTFLLVDDVVTTGSTLEACAETLLQIPGSSVFVATIACA